MKRASLLLTTLLTIALTACGGGSKPENGADDPAAASSENSIQQPPASQEPSSERPSSPAPVEDDVSSPPADSVEADRPPSEQRGMWSWYGDDITNAEAATKQLEFAVKNKITVIYLHSEILLDSAPGKLADFINLAASKDVAVELLFGRPEWTLSTNHQQAVDVVNKANAFVNSLTGAKPTGLHFDVEPHVLENWNENQVSLGNQLVELYDKLYQAKNHDLYLTADIAIGYKWVNLTRHGTTKALSHWLVDSTDRTAIMSYRDYAEGTDSIIEHASYPMQYAAETGKLTSVGIETTCGNNEPGKVTFCEEGRTVMEREIDKVISHFGSNKGFASVSIHDYRNYQILQ